MAGHVDRGAAPGLVSVVSRRGAAHVDVIGATALGGGHAMRPDTIFRISSMTKPIIAVATLILLEECVVRLDEPVERLLPELAGRRVVRRIDGPVDDTVPARRPITVRDLLTFRMGFGGYFGPCPVNEAAAPLQLSFGPPQPSLPPGPDEWMRRFSTLPLMCQPGERWLYNTGMRQFRSRGIGARSGPVVVFPHRTGVCYVVRRPAFPFCQHPCEAGRDTTEISGLAPRSRRAAVRPARGRGRASRCGSRRFA